MKEETEIQSSDPITRVRLWEEGGIQAKALRYELSTGVASSYDTGLKTTFYPNVIFIKKIRYKKDKSATCV